MDDEAADDIFAEWDDLDDDEDADIEAAASDRASQPAYQDLDDLLAGYADDETELPASDDLDAPDPDAIFAEEDIDAERPLRRARHARARNRQPTGPAGLPAGCQRRRRAILRRRLRPPA